MIGHQNFGNMPQPQVGNMQAPQPSSPGVAPQTPANVISSAALSTPMAIAPDPVWAAGEDDAKRFLVPNGHNGVIFDSNLDIFYLKSVDAHGRPIGLRRFEYKEVTSAPQDTPQVAQAPVNANDEYVTKEYLNERLDDIVNAISNLGQSHNNPPRKNTYNNRNRNKGGNVDG